MREAAVLDLLEPEDTSSKQGHLRSIALGANEIRYDVRPLVQRVCTILHDHLDNAAGDSSWVREALEILEGKS